MTNIALIVLDTLRKDYFDKHFDWLPGTRFENAWSTSHWTVPAHASLFTGRYASEVGVHAGSKDFNCPEPTIAEILRDEGYTTRAFSCNINISKNWRFDRGFEKFTGNWRVRSVQGDIFDWDVFISETRDMGPSRFPLAIWKILRGECDLIPSLRRGILLKMRDAGIGHETKDDGGEEALSHVESTDFGDNEFLFLNLMEAHTPYNPPDKYQTVEPPEVDGLKAKVSGEEYNDEQIQQAYDDSVRYLSDIYRQIFDQLHESFDYIITVSDHGEMLGEYGVYEHMYGLYPPLTNVPLVVSGPSVETETRDETVSVLDVHETVAARAGLETDGHGRDLLDDIDSGTFLTEYHTITEVNYNSVLNAGYTDVGYLKDELSGFASEDFYCCETFEDGFLEFGEYEGDPHETLDELVDDIEKREVEASDEEIDEATLKHLEDLGYA